jgi:hypothetical protein
MANASRPINTNYDFLNVARIKNLPVAQANGEPVVFEQLNAAIEGQAWKDNVRVATQANINLASPGANIDGAAMVLNDRVLARTQTTAAENGVYLWKGAGVPMVRAFDCDTAEKLENATVPVDEGTNAGQSWRQTTVNFTLGTDAVNFVVFGSSAPPASETSQGIVEIATQAEVDAGTDTARVVTPATLANSTFAKRKATADIGNGTATQFAVTHNFGTRDLLVKVYRNASPWDETTVDVEMNTTNQCTIYFSSAPSTDQFRVVIIG